MGYIDKNNNYYEGDRQGDDLIVPQRSSPTHDWDGTQWVLNPVKEAEHNARLQLIQDKQDAKIDTALASLATKTPTQLITYAKNNFPSLTVAEQTLMGKMLVMMSILVREL